MRHVRPKPHYAEQRLAARDPRHQGGTVISGTAVESSAPRSPRSARWRTRARARRGRAAGSPGEKRTTPGLRARRWCPRGRRSPRRRLGDCAPKEDERPGEVQGQVRTEEDEQGTLLLTAPGPQAEHRRGDQCVDDGPNRAKDGTGRLPPRLLRRRYQRLSRTGVVASAPMAAVAATAPTMPAPSRAATPGGWCSGGGDPVSCDIVRAVSRGGVLLSMQSSYRAGRSWIRFRAWYQTERN